LCIEVGSEIIVVTHEMETWRGFCILDGHPVYGWYFLFKSGSAAECSAAQYGKGSSNTSPHLLKYVRHVKLKPSNTCYCLTNAHNFKKQRVMKALLK
jgi:hypothetical protein